MQIVNSSFDDQAVKDFPGSIIERNANGSITKQSISFVIPQQAFVMAENTNPNFAGQFSAFYFAETFFSSNLNISDVSLLKIKLAFNL